MGWVSKARSKEEKAVLVGIPEPKAVSSVEQWKDSNVRCFDKKSFTQIYLGILEETKLNSVSFICLLVLFPRTL